MMKKIMSLMIFLVCGFLLTGCAKVMKSNTLGTASIGLNLEATPVVADLKVSDKQVRGQAKGKISRKMTEDDIVSEAVANALGQTPPSAEGPDALVAIVQFKERKKKRLNVTVTGYPAWYTNFHNAEETDSAYLLVAGGYGMFGGGQQGQGGGWAGLFNPNPGKGGGFANRALKLPKAPKKEFVPGPMSVGFGVSLISNFGGGVKNSSAGNELIGGSPKSGFGVNPFFDVTYAEISWGYLGGGGEWKTTVNGSSQGTDDFSFSGFHLRFMGKYPIETSSDTKWFPLVGIDYLMVAGAEMNGSDFSDPEDLNEFWFMFGVGTDFNLSKRWYIRPVALYGMRAANKVESDYKKGMTGRTDTRLGHGFTFNVSAGLRL
jgi:hypothetical protein